MALEFRSYKDDAWYDARVVTEGRRGTRLRIKFFNFGDDQDEFVHAKNLKKLQDVDVLRSRFRKISVQFQDTDCSRVEPGLLVCAARPVGDGDLKFYDAVFRGVVKKEHQIVKGVEVCKCTFILDWIDNGESGSCTVENICRVQDTSDEELDPVLISFLNKARERIESTFCTRLRITSGDVYDLRAPHKDASRSTAAMALGGSVEGMGADSDSLRISYEAADPKKRYKVTSPPKESLPLSCYVEGISDNASDMDGRDDMDVGGAPYMVIVENLEKEISPVTIMEFIHQQVSITCQVFVSPSKSSELYTRAIILLDNKKNLEKLSDFLESPDHIIISSIGRPWLMTEKRSLPETLRASIQTLSQSRIHGS
ncbi:uncharacterized protein LOC112189383 isoform X2 [Rosa chinensis]|uniref:uncharacterized protein LOC112189383 isoform X2 n=1 Tax=Rosa chinensis TaxID=74649 RepID=UPI001AD9470B|nr:uncharacterized protein LOC112189383 isoform X2 [Rosa chinensis]